MLVPLVLTVLTQPAPLATEAVSVQPTPPTERAAGEAAPPTEKAAGEAAPPTEKWISSSCSLSGCVHTNYLTGTTTAHDFKGGKVTTNHWTGETTASNHQGSITSNKYTGDWKAHGCNSWGCGTSGGNHRTGDYWSKGVSLSAWCAAHPGYAGCPTAVFPRPGMPGGNPTICQLKWAQCGGNSWTGATCCEAGSVCTASSAWYSQCKPSRNYLHKIDEAGELVATHAGVFAATGAFAAVFLAVGLLRRSRASRPEAATAEAPAVQLV
ncbi:hypothetical protein EMIHUDRAFT_447941 [Emiliania huxleyi CCMP1516]|uniref:CBM1 domain-containing protein n=2 Tax=Emiliania huxleyi TaxID=2903 RepID=A0A0D3J3M9_EMIH1|nr:hypothetical protein EMIHUDRAFT_452804 [Emiliania huxleyi CCMP1516]XP_005770543.1 hypothetical protein EMIHUDRAFT_447941 [Emiliania huxleyi CCMP1516]EOD09738.1 hypothetical protein EMIHUDRAFT_452804 [Emiliania huxleyi CCMP1516]EOD18114.1 hypothetical protein EMIHUDRAFT_447941 [Emiliania huxleyi CCMP1516]|eukprot:XP_005762167.1 hypothetical protein EMIHUDRAFT_452804 [Emiliania huxleyi CCMP1516]